MSLSRLILPSHSRRDTHIIHPVRSPSSRYVSMDDDLAVWDDSIDYAASPYRRHNQRFRRNMLAEICNDRNHPLSFLVQRGPGGCVWHRRRDRQIDAGHITPVAVLQRRGWQTERLAIQDRRLNRSMQATPIRVRAIRGIPVEQNTLRQWVNRGLLGPQWLRARLSRGWQAFDDDDLFFAMGNSHDWLLEFD